MLREGKGREVVGVVEGRSVASHSGRLMYMPEPRYGPAIAICSFLTFSTCPPIPCKQFRQARSQNLAERLDVSEGHVVSSCGLERALQMEGTLEMPCPRPRVS